MERGFEAQALLIFNALFIVTLATVKSSHANVHGDMRVACSLLVVVVVPVGCEKFGSGLERSGAARACKLGLAGGHVLQLVADE